MQKLKILRLFCFILNTGLASNHLTKDLYTIDPLNFIIRCISNKDNCMIYTADPAVLAVVKLRRVRWLLVATSLTYTEKEEKY